MARYIDENDVYKLIGSRGMSMVHCSQIDALPRADVVEVVRCKDCKYHRDLTGGVECKRLDGLLMPLPNDFCSYGERKE